MNQFVFFIKNSSYFPNYKRSKFDFYSDRENSKFFNHIVHGHLWIKDHKIFHTCKTHQVQDMFTVKV